MVSVSGRHLDEDTEQFARFKADLKRQFHRDCVGYFLALIALVLLSAFSMVALIGATCWTVMLTCEARATFGKSETKESRRFKRWQSRQAWLAAASGDERSLKKLQNVQ